VQNNINKVINILSKLIVANQSFKKVLKIKKTKLCLVVLELLQKQGFIYGYSNYNNDYYLIFLKYSSNYSLNNALFIKKKITVTNINTFEKNSLYFIFNKRGFYINKINNKKINSYTIMRF
jgi:ribosomal protein S8